MKRLAAIDCFRAVTMYLMIFVNDVAGVANTPGWLGHTEAAEDGMGFADTIFPAFLFIVGLSLPHAINRRFNKGESFLQVGLHLLLRSAALIIMGFFHVNLEAYHEAALLPKPVWTLLITLGFFLVWLDYPPAMKKLWRYLLMAAGIVLLLVMAYLYNKGANGEKLPGMKQSWWGILGIIGWAYLACSIVYLFIREHLRRLLVVAIVFLLINLAAHSGVPIDLPVIDDASSVTLIMAGVLIGILYASLARKNNYRRLWSFLLPIGAAMIVAGFIVRPFAGGISKIMATPAWVLICAGISTLVFAIITWITDIKKKEYWFRIIKPAGTSTLTCYLIPYILYAVYGLVGFHYPSFFNEGIGGIIRSLVVALVVVLLVGLMERIRLRLRV